MSEPLNKKLYAKAKAKADKVYKRNSAYKSMYIVKEYKKMGGKYKGKRTNSTTRWMDEKWVQITPYVKSGKKIACGAGANKKACRPLKKINKNTPTTLDKLIKKHGKKKMLELAKLKRKDMNIRINWNDGRKS